MRKVLELGGMLAAVVLIAFGIGAIATGIDGRSTVKDNLKQEQFALQLIAQFDYIFKLEGLPLLLTPYEVVSMGPDCGIIEMVKDAITMDRLKKHIKNKFQKPLSLKECFELYFENLAKGGVALSERRLKEKIVRIYGSYEKWEKSFMATGMMRGIGWVVLAYDKSKDELFNIWIDEHNTGNLVGTIPLLVMDVFEHAFMVDYGLKRADYINAFMAAVDWHAVEERI